MSDGLQSAESLPVIRAVGLGRDFDSHWALSDVDLDVHEGEIRGILGPNGAGKTTLLRIVAGLVDPSAGTITVLKERWEEKRRWLRSQVGWVQAGERSFYLRISGLENLVFFCRLHGFSLAEARLESARLMELVGLSTAASKRVGLYSHGMQRRLALARALIGDPPLLILDEVTSGLDPEATLETKEGVKLAARRGTSVLWATQRIEELRGLADTVTLLQDGRVRFDGPVQDLMLYASGMMYTIELGTGTDPDLELANRALGGLGKVEATRSPRTLELILVDDAPLGDAIVALEQSGISIQACRESRDSLELAFIRLIGART